MPCKAKWDTTLAKGDFLNRKRIGGFFFNFLFHFGVFKHIAYRYIVYTNKAFFALKSCLRYTHNQGTFIHANLLFYYDLQQIKCLFQESLDLIMDPRLSAQDVLRCHFCETPVSPLFCECHASVFCLQWGTSHRRIHRTQSGTIQKAGNNI